MLRILLILILIYFLFKAGTILLRWYIKGKLNSSQPRVKRTNEKFKDADDAKFTEYPDPDKQKNKE